MKWNHFFTTYKIRKQFVIVLDKLAGNEELNSLPDE